MNLSRRESGPRLQRLAAIALALALLAPAACAGGGDSTAERPAAPAARKIAAQKTWSSAGSYLAGRRAETAGDIGAAADFMLRALKTRPKDPALLRRTFLLMAGEGRMGEALALARRLARIGKADLMVRATFAIEAARKGDFLTAEQELAKAPPARGADVLGPLLTAWSHVGQGNIPAAEAALKRLAKVDGFKSFYNLHRALILDLAGRAKEAEKSYATFQGANVRAPSRIVEAIASFYQRTGRTDEARRELDAFIERTGDSDRIRAALARLDAGRPLPRLATSATEGMTEALFDLASALHRENVTRTALIYGRLTLYLMPDFAAGQYLVANILDSRGQSRQAVEMYGRIGRASPLHWSAQLATARNLDGLGRFNDSVAFLEEIAAKRPNRPEALVALGDLYRNKEDFKSAAAAYDRAIARLTKVGKHHWGLFYARGIALERSKDWTRAEADFLRALELQPDQPYVLNYLGYSWVEHGINLARARKMLERAVELKRGDGYITDSLGWVLYRTGHYKEAVKHLENAAELRPHDPTINDHLGDAYWKVGRQNEARFQWRRALSLKPEAQLVPTIEAKLESGLEAAKGADRDN